jgi:YVTN family beta-propeller protein
MSALAAFFLLLFPGTAAPFPDVLLVVDESADVLREFDPKSGAARSAVPIGKGPHEVELLADGRIAAVSNFGTPGEPGRTVTLVEIDFGRTLATIDLGERTQPYGLEGLPDGRFLVTAEGTKELLVVDPYRRRVATRIALGRSGFHMVVATPDGSRAFVASASAGMVTAVDLAPVRVFRNVFTGPGVEGIDVTPDGRYIWVTNPERDSVSVIDAHDLGIFPKIPVRGFPIRVKITPDGKYALVSCMRSGDLAVFDVAERHEIKRISIAREALIRDRPHVARGGPPELPAPIDLLVEPNGRYAWVASENTSVVCYVDLQTLSVSGSLIAGREPGALAGRFSR